MSGSEPDADHGPAPDADQGPPPADPAGSARRLAEIFGDVLPEATGDELDTEPVDGAAADRWYAENRPPHHDRG
ncbi:MAG: hypothetical protein ACT4O0_08315 [Pseudonocardia sp.]